MSVYIKGMDMPVDCLACRISCDKESYRVIGRPPKCPLTEAKTGDLISRADAIEAVCRTRCGDKAKGCPAHSCLVIEEFDALPSAEAVREISEDCKPLFFGVEHGKLKNKGGDDK